MADSFEKEIPGSRVRISVDQYANGSKQRVELPLKLLLIGDYSAGNVQQPLAQRKKVDINKQNFDSVLAEFQPHLKIDVPNTLAGDGSSLPVSLRFEALQDFEPEQVARQIPPLQALLVMRALLVELKSSLLDNGNFRREFGRVLTDPTLFDRLKDELTQMAARRDIP